MYVHVSPPRPSKDSATVDARPDPNQSVDDADSSAKVPPVAIQWVVTSPASTSRRSAGPGTSGPVERAARASTDSSTVASTVPRVQPFTTGGVGGPASASEDVSVASPSVA